MMILKVEPRLPRSEHVFLVPLESLLAHRPVDCVRGVAMHGDSTVGRPLQDDQNIRAPSIMIHTCIVPSNFI